MKGAAIGAACVDQTLDHCNVTNFHADQHRLGHF